MMAAILAKFMQAQVIKVNYLNIMYFDKSTWY